MEILYAYIEEYKGLKDIGVNFSNKYTVAHKREGDKIILTIEDNKGFVDGLFGKAIGSVTCIVGKNGSGKTTILDFLKRKLSQSPNSSECKGLVFLIDYELQEVFSETEDLSIESSSKFSKKQFPGFFTAGYFDTFLNPTSRFEDYSSRIINSDFLKDYSCKYLLKDSSSNLNKFQIDYNETNVPLPLAYKSYIASDFFRIIKLVAYLNGSEVIDEFRLPKFIKIRIYNDISDSLKDTANKISSLIDSNFKNNSNKRFILKLVLAELAKTTASTKNRKKIEALQHIVLMEFKNIIINFHRNFSDVVLSVSKLLGSQSLMDIDLFYRILLDSEQNSNTDYELYIDIEKLQNNSDNREQFLEFLTRFQSLVEFKLTHSNLIDTELSNGEYSILMILARIFEFLTIADDYPIIIIDELEGALHPEWQRRVFLQMTNLMNRLSILENRRVQIILSSHSPFIISDLPNFSVLLLPSSKEGGQSRIVPSELNSFGANIYDILKDSFFLENGFIGAFASKKIVSWINELQQKVHDGISESEREDYKQKINCIGQAFVKSKLLALLNSIKNSR